MKTIKDGQVQLSKLIFTHNWEDPAVDEEALQISEGDTVFSITSGGCNTLGFLRFNPANIYCVDINPAQTYLMELKQAIFRRLAQPDTLKMLGLHASGNRQQWYEQIEKDLSEAAQVFWRSHNSIIKKGIIMNGRYERFTQIAGLLMRLLQGPGKVKQLFACDTIEEQKTFYENRWDNKRWRWVFDTMFNKKRLAKKGLNADYFHFDDGASSFSESFYRRAAHALTDLPVRSNYFLALYLLGHYLNDEMVPGYLQPAHYSTIRQNIDRIHPFSEDSKYWLEKQPDNFFDAMALSNICELMDDTDTLKFFTEVARTAKPGCRIVFRNLMIPREVPEPLRSVIVKDEEKSRLLQYRDRSFVYSKVAAYVVNK